MNRPPYPARAVVGILLRFMVVLAGALTVSSLHADQFSLPLPPVDISTLRVTATPERTTYRLGETVRVRYAVANHGTETVTIRRDNDTTFWRAESLHVLAFDAGTGAPVPAVAGGIDVLNYRYGRRASIAPGETWEHDFFPLRYVALPGPGRYRFQLRHTLGWPDSATAPAAPEFPLEFTAPTAAEAARIVASLPPLSVAKDDAPLPVDTFGFNYPVYLPYLVKRIASGEPALLDSIARMMTPEATSALIELATNPHKTVANAARHKLLHRLPWQEGTVSYGMEGPDTVSFKNRGDSAWTPAQELAARTLVRALIKEELPSPDAQGFVSSWDSPAFIAAALLAHFGEADDLSALAQGLERVSYARTLDAHAYRNHRFDSILPDEIDAYRRAYDGMRARGVRAPFAFNGLGESILAFDEARLGGKETDIKKFGDDMDIRSSRTKGPRSAEWFAALDLLTKRGSWAVGPDSFGVPEDKRPPNPMILIAALESIPAPCPPECVPFIEFAFESDVPQVIHAACAVAVETDSKVFASALLRVLHTESDPRVRVTAATALARTGDRLAALRELSGDLAFTPEPSRIIAGLSAILVSRRPNSVSGWRTLSRSERLALCEAWRTFIRENETRLAESGFEPGDPKVPTALFTRGIGWNLPLGKTWPARED